MIGPASNNLLKWTVCFTLFSNGHLALSVELNRYAGPPKTTS